MTTKKDLDAQVTDILKNLDTINKFIVAAEKEIYETEDLDSYDTETLMQLYKYASDRQIKMLEFSRKLLTTKIVDEFDDEMMQLAKMLKAMNKVELEKVKENLKGRIH